MSLLHVSMKRIRSKTAEQMWQHSFSHDKSMGRWSDLADDFELLRAFMHVLVTCKHEKDRIKNHREKEATPFSPLKPYGNYLLPRKLEF